MNQVDEVAVDLGIGRKSLYSVPEVAAITGYSKESIYHFVKSGELKAKPRKTEHRRNWRISSNNLQVWVDGNE